MLEKRKQLSKRKIISISLLIMGIALILVSICLFVDGAISNAAGKSQTILKAQEYLQKDTAFYVEVENWIEKKAFERVINQHNKEQGYNKSEQRYNMYKIDGNRYWVTSPIHNYKDFCDSASDICYDAGMMLDGLKKEKVEYYFVCIGRGQEVEIAGVITLLRRAENELETNIEEVDGKEVKFLHITVEPKSSLKGGM